MATGTAGLPPEAVAEKTRSGSSKRREMATHDKAPSGASESNPSFTPVAEGQPMRLAYADPPYPGQAKKYRDQPDYAGEVDHAGLIESLCSYDGWALSTNSRSLQYVLSLCPPGVRTVIWIKPGASPPFPHHGVFGW